MSSRIGRVVLPATMFIAGLVAASALSGSVAAAPAQVASTLTRVTNCAGFDFMPIDSLTKGSYFHRTRTRAGTVGDGIFVCDPHLPDKATVTSVRFTVQDPTAGGSVQNCGPIRVGLSSSSSASNDPVGMSLMPATGLEEHPGYVRSSDTSISHATIDEANYAYYLQCQIDNETTSSAGIVGATVTYRISSTNG